MTGRPARTPPRPTRAALNSDHRAHASCGGESPPEAVIAEKEAIRKRQRDSRAVAGGLGDAFRTAEQVFRNPTGKIGQVRVPVDRNLKEEPHLPDTADKVLRG